MRASIDNSWQSKRMLGPHTLSPATGTSEDGATVADLGAIDGGRIGEEDGRIVCGVLRTGAAVGGPEGLADSGEIVGTATTIGARVPAVGWIEGAGDAAERVGLGDERTAAGDGVGADIQFGGGACDQGGM